jgi:cob(I)alamin adenosyltransferase
MTKSNLYTRTGDTGTTSLVGGARVKKNSERLEAYGTLDEFSSQLGCVLSDPSCPPEIRAQLLDVQNMLFNVGCYLATAPEEGKPAPVVTGLDDEVMSRLEHWIDELDEKTPRVKAFVLPGGSPLAAMAHVARTTCRRAERRILDLNDVEPVAPIVIGYVNRLSDYLFILARYFNHLSGVEEIIWRR